MQASAPVPEWDEASTHAQAGNIAQGVCIGMKVREAAFWRQQGGRGGGLWELVGPRSPRRTTGSNDILN